MTAVNTVDLAVPEQSDPVRVEAVRALGAELDFAGRGYEPAGAAALAAVLAAPQRFAGRNMVVVCGGGNISPARLVALWPQEAAAR